MAALVQRVTLSATSSRASTFHGSSMNMPVHTVSKAVQVPFQVEAAHKKGTGSSKNGRDSNAQRLGVKVYGDQAVKAGGIIVRQRGMTYKADEGCFMGKDFTIHAKIDGVVKFKKNKTVHKIQVFPDEPVEYDRSADTRRNRRLAQYPPRATLREAESS